MVFPSRIVRHWSFSLTWTSNRCVRSHPSSIRTESNCLAVPKSSSSQPCLVPTPAPSEFPNRRPLPCLAPIGDRSAKRSTPWRGIQARSAWDSAVPALEAVGRWPAVAPRPRAAFGRCGPVLLPPVHWPLHASSQAGSLDDRLGREGVTGSKALALAIGEPTRRPERIVVVATGSALETKLKSNGR